MSEKIIMYAHNTCPEVPAVIGMLKQSKADYEYINIRQDEAARERVLEINDGYASVPTLVFPDGSTLTEPSATELRGKLRSLGYKVPLYTLIFSNIHLIVTGLIVLYGLLSFLEII